MFEQYAPTFVLCLTGVLIVLAAYSDAKRFRIPNWANLCILLLFPVYVLVAPQPLAWGMHLLTFAIFFIVGYGLYLKKLAGAGDIKMIAVLALWAGPIAWAQFLFITAMTGGILAIGIGAATLIKKKLGKTAPDTSFAKTPIPYGIAIAVGGLSVLFLLSHPDLIKAQV